MKKKKEQKYNSPKFTSIPKPETKSRPNERLVYAGLGIIILISFLSYLPVFSNGLLAWDDNAYIKDNPLIYSLNLKDIFSTNVMGNYHPVTILTFALQYKLFGLNPVGYHAINLILHLGNTILVFFVLYRLSSKTTVALIAALLFGVHPIHVESVAWAAELKDLLYTFFFLLSFIFYLKYIEIQRKKFFGLSLLFFLFSLLSKAMAASLPLVLILTDYFKGRRIDKKTLVEKIPFLMLSLIFGIVAVFAQKSSGATDLTAGYTFLERLVFASYGFVSYLVKLVFPLNLSSFYPYPAAVPGYFYIYTLIFLGIAIYTFYSRQFTKKIFFGIGFFTLTLLLVLQIIPAGKAVMADRYGYIPSIGIFYLAGEGFMILKSKKLTAAAIVLLSIITILFSVKTFTRSKVWKDDLTLWNDVISRDKTVAEAFYNRGIIYLKGNNTAAAHEDFKRVLELAPYDASTHNGMGIVLTREKKFEEAVREFDKAIESNPGYAEAYINRGIVYKDMNNYAEALRDFTKAVELDKRNAEAYFNRGTVFLMERIIDEGLKDFTRAIELNPGYAEAYNSRGSVFTALKRNREAIADLNKAIELNPGYAEAYYNRGSLFSKEKRNAEAINDFNKAIQLKPDYANAYNNRGIVYVNEKRNQDAVRDFTKVIELAPGMAEAYNNRGIVLMNEGKNAEAISDFIKAVELNPSFTGAYNNLGNIFFESKRYHEASRFYSRVIELKPDHSAAYYRRGIAEYNSGNRSSACDDLNKAVQLGNKQAPEAISQLCK